MHTTPMGFDCEFCGEDVRHLPQKVLHNPPTEPNTAPICEDCGIQMQKKIRRSDRHEFYGCPNYPRCTRTESCSDDDYGDE